MIVLTYGLVAIIIGLFKLLDKRKGSGGFSLTLGRAREENEPHERRWFSYDQGEQIIESVRSLSRRHDAIIEGMRDVSRRLDFVDERLANVDSYHGAVVRAQQSQLEATVTVVTGLGGLRAFMQEEAGRAEGRVVLLKNYFETTVGAALAKQGERSA